MKVDQREKRSSLVNCLLWTSTTTRFVIGPLGFIVSKHVFLPSIGHVGQSKTSELAFPGGRTDKVYESVTRAVTIVADKSKISRPVTIKD